MGFTVTAGVALGVTAGVAGGVAAGGDFTITAGVMAGAGTVEAEGDCPDVQDLPEQGVGEGVGWAANTAAAHAWRQYNYSLPGHKYSWQFACGGVVHGEQVVVKKR